jgi:hypothetical protein
MRSVALLIAISVMLAGCHDDRRRQTPPDRRQRQQAWRRNARALAEQAERLVTLRRLLRWYEVTQGEPNRLALLLPPISTLVPHGQLLELRLLENSTAVSDIERRGLRLLRAELQQLRLLQPQVDLIERFSEISLRPLPVPQLPVPIDFHALSGAIAGASQRAERQAIHRAALPTLRQLDDLLRRRQQRMVAARSEVEPGLYAVLEERSARDTPTLLAKASEAVRATAGLYLRLPRTAAAGGDRAPLTYTDLIQLQGGGQRSQLPDTEAAPALQELLRDLGLQLGHGEERIRVGVGRTSACVPVHPPFDVRLARREHSGLAAMVEFFEAAGRCVCEVHCPQTLPWERRALGPAIGARALGHVLGLVWLERPWLELRPQRLSDDVVVDLVQRRILHELLRLRVEGRVMPAVRALIADAPAAARRAWSATASEPAALFAELMGRELGLRLSPEEALGYLYELDLEERDGDGGLDLRALVLGHLVLEQLRKDLGPRWFTQRDAGRRLIGGLCQAGSTATAEELARPFRRDGLDYTTPARTLAAAWRSVQPQQPE